MIARFHTSRKERSCAQCGETIPIGARYLSILLGTRNEKRKMPFNMHPECLGNWDATRPRRKPLYRGRAPLTVTSYDMDGTATEAFTVKVRCLTDDEKRRRAILIANGHRYQGRRDIEPILKELESLGGIPRGLR